ncbi:MAG: hypothetical protein QME88_08935 [Actinomycetota bacterium]|nr:hypothetical protein [Actinomycetota bacterium]
MTRCGGCGREFELEEVEAGSRFLCARCLHLEVAGPRPRRVLDHRAFLAVAVTLLALLFAAGSLLCALYLVGAGNLAWFMVLAALMLVVMASATSVLARRRNLALLLGSLYLPLGIWACAWRLAPGAGWELSRATGYGGLMLLGAGAVCLYVFGRDARRLPRR